ncbi:MAG: biotin/lipoyl-containing protein [Candidatus Electryonea clarkiae]|nr:biotin/lipoyl-containing protein [Candidatus Electryonea clarkiae]MDP8286796.1 biotin/lipoyl-containing protein [Candidatus Electryonea clarkiae]
MRTKELRKNNETINVKAEFIDGNMRAQVNGDLLEGPLLRTSHGAGLWKVNGTSYRIVATEHDGKIWAAVNGRVYSFEDARAQDEMGQSADNENSVTAPMPGKVIKVLVQTGDTVEEGQPVVIVEAMKMEHILRAPKDGTITKIDCAEGQHADPGVPLVEIE